MRKWLIGAILGVAAYLGYPYLTLYWIDHALLTNDEPALERLVDWPEVRQGLKADVKLALIDAAQTQAGKDGFAGVFGAALTALLVPTLVDSAVDEWVTPEKVLNSEEVVKHRQEQKSFADFVTYAFFTSPTEFRVDLKDPKDPNSPSIAALMRLSGLRWRVIAIKLPPVSTWLNGSTPRASSSETSPPSTPSTP
ncbi:DUF2939 domain-containing protein [Methyloceanibacter sp.]|uniref:DUF2939 domain-containing protein n=1 Tax=Methyloceanibacter sp. TaxID=1965321 RepID=UPI002D360FBA|nr:DUF2939 domain-containing protein [Methyloceanibacter sp.]HZP10160.1 DUF2939 domain-containing protein [Methyloceanibacter sp.]